MKIKRQTVRYLVISDLQVPYHHEAAVKNVIKLARRENLPELQYPAFMGFAEMGMTYHKTAYEFHDNWVLCHGDEGNMSQHAGITALNLAKKFGKSVLAGHSHRLGISAYSEGVNGHYRALYGVEVGNLMDRKKAAYIRYGSANWQMGFAILEASGKTLTPTLVPVNKDGSFTALGRHYGA